MCRLCHGCPENVGSTHSMSEAFPPPPLGGSATGLFFQPQMMMSVGQWVARETKVLGETCSSAALYTAIPTWPGSDSNPGRRGGQPATNRLS
jgi:hypothetical protein